MNTSIMFLAMLVKNIILAGTCTTTEYIAANLFSKKIKPKSLRLFINLRLD